MSEQKINACLDCMNEQVRVGDWLIQPGRSSNGAPLKFCNVVSISRTGRPQVVSFEYYRIHADDRAVDGPEFAWGRGNSAKTPYALTRVDKAYKLPEMGLPPLLVDYIRDVLKGDVRRGLE